MVAHAICCMLDNGKEDCAAPGAAAVTASGELCVCNPLALIALPLIAPAMASGELCESAIGRVQSTRVDEFIAMGGELCE
jgi:hypothetical protein